MPFKWYLTSGPTVARDFMLAGVDPDQMKLHILFQNINDMFNFHFSPIWLIYVFIFTKLHVPVPGQGVKGVGKSLQKILIKNPKTRH